MYFFICHINTYDSSQAKLMIQRQVIMKAGREKSPTDDTPTLFEEY